MQEYARRQVFILEQEDGSRYTGVVHLIVEIENEGAMRLYGERGFVVSETDMNEDDHDDDDELCTLSWSTAN